MHLEARTQTRSVPGWLGVLLGVWFLATGFLGIATMSHSIGWHWFALTALPFAAVAFTLHQATSPRVRKLHVTADGLDTGDETIARARLRSGFYVPAVPGGHAHVVLERVEGDPIEIDVDGEERARELLATLGLDVDRHAVRFRLRGPPPPLTDRRVQLAVVAAAVYAVAAALLAPAALFLFFVGLPLAELVRMSDVHVGADGVLIRGFLGATFVPVDRLVGVETRDRETLLLTKDGPIVIADDSGSRDGNGAVSVREYVAALAARVRAVIEARGHASTNDAARVLERGASPLREWLATLATRDGDAYRSAGLATDELAHVLETSPSRWARLGAAILLARRKAEVPRIRVAAGASAEPRVRVALETIANLAADADVERALADVDAEAEAEAAADAEAEARRARS